MLKYNQYYGILQGELTMDERQYGLKAVLLHPVTAVVVIVFGLLLGGGAFFHNQTLIQEGQDTHRMDTAQSVDNNILGHFTWYCSDLKYITAQEDFAAAERLWLETGDGSALLGHMEENPLPQSAKVETVLAVRRGRPVLSTNGRMDYTRLAGLGTVNGVDIALYTDGEGRPCVAMETQGAGQDYVAVIDGAVFFSVAGDKSTAKSKDQLYLLDAAGEYFFYAAGAQPRVERVSELAWEAGTVLGQMLERQGEGVSACVSFAGEIKAEGKEKRFAVLPAGENANGCFTVGLASAYDDYVGFLRSATIQIALCGGIIAAGMALLLFSLLKSNRDHRLLQEELALLKEKAAVMERLNAQTQELAHHQRLETIGTMTSSIAHEFNNLLTPIMGYSILVLEKLPAEDTESYDNTLEIYHSAQKAKEIISRLSDLSRKSSSATFRRLALDHVAAQALQAAAPAQPKNVRVEKRLEEKELALEGNETQLSQLILNLLLNAFAALEEQGGVVELSAFSRGEWVCLRVADDGPGIPEELREKIFDPFFTTKGSGKGTGLGLAIVRQIAEGHGGRVELEATARGAAFLVSFPRLPPE